MDLSEVLSFQENKKPYKTDFFMWYLPIFKTLYRLQMVVAFQFLILSPSRPWLLVGLACSSAEEPDSCPSADVHHRARWTDAPPRPFPSHHLSPGSLPAPGQASAGIPFTVVWRNTEVPLVGLEWEVCVLRGNGGRVKAVSRLVLPLELEFGVFSCGNNVQMKHRFCTIMVFILSPTSLVK